LTVTLQTGFGMNLQSTPYSELMPHKRNQPVPLNPLQSQLSETVSPQGMV